MAKNRGWTVTFSGTESTWLWNSLHLERFQRAIKTSIDKKDGVFTWDPASLNDPYAICCLVFAFAMILAGKCQDKFGPRVTAFMGGILVSIGLILISQTTSYAVWVLGFGLLAGTGIGFGYSAATPPALKWFPPQKTGLIAGLVVSGFGLPPCTLRRCPNIFSESGASRVPCCFSELHFSLWCAVFQCI